MRKPMKRFLVALREDELEELNKELEESGRTRTGLVRVLLRQWMQKRKEGKR